jgi:hypothetical protein
VKRLSILLVLTVFGSVTSQVALADHNSPHGAGWAQMPNDIHNTRIDTLGDDTAFRDFVRYGNGATTVNRYASDSDVGRRIQGAFGQSDSGSGGGRGMRGSRGFDSSGYASNGSSAHGGGRRHGGGRGH